jgi:hypothetical protein
MPKGKNLKRCHNFVLIIPHDFRDCDCRVCGKLDGELHFENGELIEVHCTNRRMHEPPLFCPKKGSKKPVGEQ